ncbi:MAG: hypothetical protein V3U86_07560, partial [Acidobacteriota bacterium]
HDEFLGTGGSLYFLRNQWMTRGSEKIRIEVRDKITGIPVANITQQNYVDYEIVYAEGRILFRSPVSTVANSSTIISDQLLNGNNVFVIVDYEYTPPTSSTLDDTTYGARVKHSIGKNVTVGATYVQEERTTGEYNLQGGDITIKAGKNTEIKAEFSQSEDEAVAQYVSLDGGLSFVQKPVPVSTDPAQAYKFEFASGNGPAKFTGYYRHIDAGFSSSFSTGIAETNQVGATAAFSFGNRGKLTILLDNLEVVGVSTKQTGTLQYRQRFGKFGATAEVRYRDTDNELSPDLTEGIGAIRFDYWPTQRVNLFARHQDDFLQEVDGLDATTGVKQQTTVGVDTKISPKVSAKAEFTTGEQGNSGLVGLTTQIDRRTKLYGTYTMSPDHNDVLTGTTTIGVTTAVNDRTRLYTEQQFKNNERQSSSSNVVGFSTKVSDRLVAGINFERTNLEGTGGNPDTRRQATSASISFVQDRFKVFSKLELRQDEGTGIDRDQWLTSNSFELKAGGGLTVGGRFNYGITEDNITQIDKSIFREQSFGFAFRPIHTDWINFMGRYTEVRNLPPDSQTLVRDETIDKVYSFQTVVDLNRRLTLTEKYAVRDRTIDQQVLGDLRSRMRLWINRFDFHLSDTWDAALEYRVKSLDEAGDNEADGFLLEINRLFMDHLRLGVGYNFTDFTDNEFSVNDYSANGVFFRIQGKY